MIAFEKYKELTTLFNNNSFMKTSVIPWATPILYFGNLEKASIATLGINPSNKEFFDNKEQPLSGEMQRFHTLNSLHIKNWNELEQTHYKSIIDSYKLYFRNNPYDSWFKKLDFLLSGISKSYYFPSEELCHLDLVPFATNNKWSNISELDRNTLLKNTVSILKEIINISKIDTLILNGHTVIKYLEKVSNEKFCSTEIEDWILLRKDLKHVKGIAYTGKIAQINGESLNRQIKIVGFNHNIQSSYGINKEVMVSIKDWITNQI